MKVILPTAVPCGYAVQGLCFYYIPMAENNKPEKEEKIALVRALEGGLTVDQLAVELDRMLPGKENWEIEERGRDAFTINFPSTDLLNYMVNWGPMDTKSVTAKIRFEKGSEHEVYKSQITKVWVQFRGLPKELK